MEAMAYQQLMDRLDRMESKINEAMTTRTEVAVLKAEMKLIKFVAGGLGVALLTLVAEAAWRVLTAV